MERCPTGDDDFDNSAVGGVQAGGLEVEGIEREVTGSIHASMIGRLDRQLLSF